MIIPIRCFTCGKEISSYYNKFTELKSKQTGNSQMGIPQIFEMLGIKRICCKRMFMGNVDISNNFLLYEMTQNRQ